MPSSLKTSNKSTAPPPKTHRRSTKASDPASVRASVTVAQAGNKSKLKSPAGTKPGKLTKSRAVTSKPTPKPIKREVKPAANDGHFRGRIPKVHTEHTHDGSILHVEHEEMVDSIISSHTSEAFFAKRFSLNPMSGNLPWLAGLASRYDWYAVDKIELTYTPNVGTTTNGRVALAVNLDATDALPSSLAELLMINGAETNAVYDTVRTILRVGEKAINWYYNGVDAVAGVNPGEGVAESNDRLSTVGDIYAAVVGVSGISEATGILTCKYKYRFKIPEMIERDEISQVVYRASFANDMPAGTAAGQNALTYNVTGGDPTGGVRDTSAMGSLVRIVAGASGAPFPTSPGTHEVFFRLPPGRYRIDWYADVSDSTTWSYAEVYGDGFRPVVLYDEAPQGSTFIPASNSGANGPSRTLTPTTGTAATSLTDWQNLTLTRHATVHFVWYNNGVLAPTPVFHGVDIGISRRAQYTYSPITTAYRQSTDDVEPDDGIPEGAVAWTPAHTAKDPAEPVIVTYDDAKTSPPFRSRR